jgi:hypothetical protein
MSNLNDDLNDDLDDDLDSGAGGDAGDDGHDGGDDGTGKPAVRIGEQDDGSAVLVLDDKAAADVSDPDAPKEGDTDEAALEAKRAQRREERAEQKRKRAEREERNRRELASEREARKALEQRLAIIERRSEGSELAQVDEGIKRAAQQYNYQKEVLAAAQAAGNGAATAEAIEKMLTARQQHDQLTNVKTAYQQRQAAPPPLDPRLKNLAEKFMERNTWFKAEGNDADSQVTRALDNSLVSEGFDPKTEGYWDELQNRIKKYLPHRIASGKLASQGTSDSNSKPRSVVSGSTRDSAASVGNPATFKLSADRVNALKESGLWDDPKKRDEAVRRYREYDKANGKA